MSRLTEVKKQLKGLGFVYKSHSNNGVIDMAQTDRISVIWHKWAFADADEVEVYVYSDGDVTSHIKISGLREFVKSKS